VELSEGIRPNVQALPLEAWTGLPPVRVDEQHHDPIVIDAGTVVGICTGTWDGKLFPAVWNTGGTTQMTMQFLSTDGDWGLDITDQTPDPGIVKPIGVVYQPIYSFNLEQYFTNYKRVDNVGVVTQYVVQVPAMTDDEHAIRAGDLVMVAHNQREYGRPGELSSIDTLAGRYQKYDANLAGVQEFIVGRCLKSFAYATGGTATTKYQDDTASGLTTSAAALAEFPGLDKVETVPGMKLSGSGTGGVPGHLLGGYSDGSGNYRAITILVRL
jgi:hypothetical protein